jgi:hypothetical protein
MLALKPADIVWSKGLYDGYEITRLVQVHKNIQLFPDKKIKNKSITFIFKR